MAKELSKSGISTGQDILAGHVTQSVDALTGTEAYDITVSGSLTITGSTFIQPTNVDTGTNVLTVDSSGKVYKTGSYNAGGGTTPTWQQVTDQGASTTNDLTITGNITASNLIITASNFAVTARGAGDDIIHLAAGVDSDIYIKGDDYIRLNNNQIRITGSITASAHISASGIVYGETGSFSHLQGNSPITVGDSTTFQQSITASGDISASGFLFITASEFDPASQILTYNTESGAVHYANFHISTSTSTNTIGDDNTDLDFKGPSVSVVASSDFNIKAPLTKFSTAAGIQKAHIDNTTGNAKFGDSSVYISASGDISASGTASAAYFIGDGSGLTNLPASNPFPFTGEAQITGSLFLDSGSFTYQPKSGSSEAALGSFKIKGYDLTDTGDRFFDVFTMDHVVESEESTLVRPRVLFKSALPQNSGGITTVFFGTGSGDNSAASVNIHGEFHYSNATNKNFSVSGSLGSIMFSSILPLSTTTSTLGQSINRWNAIYAKTGSFSGEVSGSNFRGDNLFLKQNAQVTGSLNVVGETNVTLGITTLAGITAGGNVSSSITSTASFGTYLGDGSQLSNISTTPFPFTGVAQITGSIIMTGSSDEGEFITFDPVSGGDVSIGTGKNTTYNGLEINTAAGKYVQIGAQNASYVHFYTDANNYYFNKPVHIAGNLYSVGQDFIIGRNSGVSDTITLGDKAITLELDNNDVLIISASHEISGSSVSTASFGQYKGQKLEIRGIGGGASSGYIADDAGAGDMKFGIGTDSPTDTLDVAGGIKASMDLTARNATFSGSLVVSGSSSILMTSGSSTQTFGVGGYYKTRWGQADADFTFFSDDYINLLWNEGGTDQIEGEIKTNPSSGEVHIITNNDGAYTYLDRQVSDGVFDIDSNLGNDENLEFTIGSPMDNSYPFYRVTIRSANTAGAGAGVTCLIEKFT